MRAACRHGFGMNRGAPGECRQNMRTLSMRNARKTAYCRTPAAYALPPGHRLHVLVALEQAPLARVLGHLLPADEDVLRAGGQLERIARPDDDVGVLAGLEGAVAICNAPHACGYKGHCLE